MTGSLVTDQQRQRIRGWVVPIATALGRIGLTPNALTIIGFAGTCLAALMAASQQWLIAGLLVLAFGIFDMFDGALARATGTASRFGAFLDSTLDRTGESLVLAGAGVGAATGNFIAGVALAGLALAFASIVTYTRAKAESLGVRGDIGIAPRPERLVISAIGFVLVGLFGGVHRPFDGLFPRPFPDWSTDDGSGLLAVTLGLIALFSAITVVQRIVHVKRQLGDQ